MERVRVLIIEDQQDLADKAKREILDAFEQHEGITVDVEIELDFREGLTKVRSGEGDVVVLDVRRDSSEPSPGDDMAGHSVFLELKDARFTPVVFWTALPGHVASEQMDPLVAVVDKDDWEGLSAAIEAAVVSRAIGAISSIEQQVADVLRGHMWSELGPNWQEYTEHADSGVVAQVLLSRLARVLDDDRDRSFTAHPSHRYVYPPVSESRSPGDVLRSTDQTWWVVLTPACDFEQGKVGYVLLAAASPLGEHPKYQKWLNSEPGSGGENSRWNSLRQDVLMATRGRFHYLPAFREIPELVIDLENVRSVEVSDLSAFAPVASLVSPFAEALLIQYSQHRGRIGVPDLDSDLIKERLAGDRQPAAPA